MMIIIVIIVITITTTTTTTITCGIISSLTPQDCETALNKWS
jgi:hypothetical protein